MNRSHKGKRAGLLAFFLFSLIPLYNVKNCKEVIRMKVLLIIGSIATPLLMFFLQKKWSKSKLGFNMAAILSALLFGNIASLAIHEIIKDNTVFMTNIHALFLNPFFLMTGAYLGVYLMYRLILLTLDEGYHSTKQRDE